MPEGDEEGEKPKNKKAVGKSDSSASMMSKSSASAISTKESFLERIKKSGSQQLTRKAKYGDDLCPKSLNIFPLHSKFRWKVLHIVEAPLFDKVILLLILLNSACMAAYRYRADTNPALGKPKDSLNSVIELLDPWFLLVFIIECMLKVIAYGFCMAKKTYLR